MALRGKKPSTLDKRLKAMFYGSAGAGKTTAAASMPQVYLIDTEDGASHDSYTRLIEKNNGVIFKTHDFDEIVAEVRALLTEKHDYRTLVIDSITVVYNDLLDKCERSFGTDFGRHFGAANKKVKHLLSLLMRLDMNVVVTAHSKKEYGANLTVLGETYDGYKKLDYVFDLVLDIQKRGIDRVAVVKKSRLEGFPDGDSFSFSYDALAERYGRKVLEKDSSPEQLATPEQVEQFLHLVSVLRIDAVVIDKWLDKGHADNVMELNSENIQKCIDFMRKKIDGPEVKNFPSQNVVNLPLIVNDAVPISFHNVPPNCETKLKTDVPGPDKMGNQVNM